MKSLLVSGIFTLSAWAPAANADNAKPGADETALGTVVVDGAASTLPPLPKLAIATLSAETAADSALTDVVRGDLDLSGQFQVLTAAEAQVPRTKRDAPIDLRAFGNKGAEYVVRVFADASKTPTRLVAEAYLPPKASAGAGSKQKPAYRGEVEIDDAGPRVNAHRLVDKLLGGLTGRPGGFASELAFAARSGSGRRVFALDADGADLHAVSPEQATAISPAFGPGGRVFYALSRDYSPFRLAEGQAGTTQPFTLSGSVLGVAFSPDAKKAAFTVMSDGQSSLLVAEGGRFERLAVPSHANHPAFGPLGKIAYAAGYPTQRIFVGDKPVSPAGSHASSPVFCDSPEGLHVLFAIDVGDGADIFAVDSSGGNLHRFTQHQGANTSPACSPDGRLVAFFSTRDGSANGRGLYVAPVARPWLAKRISSETGESLTWARASR